MTNNYLKSTALAALVAGVALGGIAGSASAESIELGYLECELTQDTGNIVVSGQTYSCTFDPNNDAKPTEMYLATSERFGIDLSKTHSETLRWVVLAAGQPDQPGALAGDYAGVSADASAGAGVGAKLLVGGLQDTITLQPLSISTQEGYGLAVFVESMDLVFVGTQS